MIQEETGILRSGVRGDGGETEAGVTGWDSGQSETGSAELRGQQAWQPLPLCPPNPKQMQSSPVLLICLHAQLPELDPKPQGPKRTEAWGERGPRKLKMQEPRVSCTADTPKPAENTDLRLRGAQSCRASHPR